MLVLEDWNTILERMEFYKNAASKKSGPEPVLMSGTLVLDAPRHFRCETGTPLLLYFPTKETLVGGKAIDLVSVQEISLEGKCIFLDLEFELHAPSIELAQEWHVCLLKRKAYFDLRRASNLGRLLFRQAMVPDSNEAKRQFEESVAFLANVNTAFPLAQFIDVEPFIGDVHVRGETYLHDHVKISSLRSQPLMKLVAIDCYRDKLRMDHVSSHPSNRMAICKAAGKLPPFTWVVSIQFPGGKSVNYSMVMYFCPATFELAQSLFSPQPNTTTLPVAPQFPALLRKFFFDPQADSFRDERFKLVPTIREAPFLVKSVVPNKPAKLGQKLTQRYFLNENYMEMNVDVASSVVADRITRLSVGASTKLVCQLSFVLEGMEDLELPEEILASLTYKYVNVVETAVPLE